MDCGVIMFIALFGFEIKLAIFSNFREDRESDMKARKQSDHRERPRTLNHSLGLKEVLVRAVDFKIYFRDGTYRAERRHKRPTPLQSIRIPFSHTVVF
jgi:hypothetical protein